MTDGIEDFAFMHDRIPMPVPIPHLQSRKARLRACTGYRQGKHFTPCPTPDQRKIDALEKSVSSTVEGEGIEARFPLPSRLCRNVILSRQAKNLVF